MDPKELVEIGLHVLVSWNGGTKPDPREVEILRAAFPSSAHLPIDDLACQVIHDLSGLAFPESKQRDRGHQPDEQVA